MSTRVARAEDRASRLPPNERIARPPKISQPLLKIFASYSESYVRRHFNSVRLLIKGAPQSCAGLPLIVYLNHSSWWDPLVCLLLARRFFKRRHSYAPIEAAALRRYRFFRRLGFFGVAHDSLSGAKDFFLSASSILRSDENALWITPEGRFTDFHARPVKLQRGLSHLTRHVARAAFIPLAIQYVYWEERLPEVLISFGEPILFEADHPLKSDDATRLFESALTSVQDHLANASQRRDSSEWQTISRGKSGTGSVYDSWRRARAWLRRERFDAAHSDL